MWGQPPPAVRPGESPATRRPCGIQAKGDALFLSPYPPPVLYFGYFALLSPDRTIAAKGKSIMKRLLLVFIFVSGLALAQEKPRDFVQGKGSEDVATNGSGVHDSHWATWGAKSTIDSQDEGMECTKDVGIDCFCLIVDHALGNAVYV